MFTPDEAIRANMRQHREALGWSQAQLSIRLRATRLCTWSPSVVALVEGGRQRTDRLNDVAALCAVFEVPLVALLAAPDGLALPPLERGGEARVVQPSTIALAMEGKPVPFDLDAVPDSAKFDEERVARLAGITREQLFYLLYDVFGVFDFKALRDKRAGLVASHKHDDTEATTRARRGHATRSILAALQERIDRDGLDVAVQRGNTNLSQWLDSMKAQEKEQDEQQ